jgi:minichromosome maintenance protein 10
MSVGSSSQKRKAAYDPQRKWGLAPANNGSAVSPSSSSQADAGGPTYVVAGHIVAGVAGRKHDMFLKESLGREAQARSARRANSHDTDVALKRLLARDKEGMRAVQEARRFARKARKRQDGKAVVRKGEEDVGDDDDNGDDDDESSGSDEEEENCRDDGDGGALADRPRPTKNAYSARVIKELGFDPTAKSFRGSHGRRHKGQEKEEKEKEDSRNKIYSEVLSVSPLSTVSPGGIHAMFFFSFFWFAAVEGACIMSAA